VRKFPLFDEGFRAQEVIVGHIAGHRALLTPGSTVQVGPEVNPTPQFLSAEITELEGIEILGSTPTTNLHDSEESIGKMSPRA